MLQTLSVFCISANAAKLDVITSNTTGDGRTNVSNMMFLPYGSSSADPSGNCGISGSNVTWSYNTTTYVLTISGSGQMTNYDENYETPWDSYRDYIKTINIGSGVTSIGDCAFGYLYALTSVSIPSTVTKIGKDAFHGSQKLSSVTIPNSVISIGDDAFSGCKYLQTISIGSGVSSMGKSTFSGCDNSSTITVNSANTTFEVSNGVLINKSTSTALFIPYRKNDGVIIPEGVTTLAENLFYNHKYITSITLPSTLTTINGNSMGWFTNCNNLTAINVNTNADSYDTKYVSKDGVFYIKYGWDLSLVKCPVKNSGSITIPEHTTYIYSDAFTGCASLTSMTVIPSTPPTVEEFYQSPAFASLISAGTKVVVRENLLDTYKSVDKWSTITNWDVIPSSFVVDGIKYATGYYNPSCVSVEKNANPNHANDPDAVLYSGDLVIPSTVTYQGVTYNVTDINWSYAFTNSPDLKSITFPASAMEEYVSIGTSCFTGCTSLSHLNMIGDATNYFTYDGVLYYRNQGVWEGNTYNRDKWNSQLMICPPGREGTVVICDTVTSLRQNQFPFTNCSKVTAFQLSGESDLWTEEDGVLYTKDKTKVMLCPPGKESVTLTKTITMIYSYAFYNNRAIKSIVLPDGVTSIGSSAFYNCSNLESINTPSALTVIGSNAFYGCNKLSTVPLPEGTTSIPDYAYQGMKGLTSFVVPSTVTSIGKYAFSYCQNLESITIPESVTSIGESCFNGCTSLTSITVLATEPPTVGDYYSLGQVNKKTCLLIVPEGCVSAYQSATFWKDFENIVGIELDTDVSALSNVIYVDNTEVNIGRDVELSIKLKNSTMDVSAFSFNLELPECFSVTKVSRGERLKAMNDDDEYIFSFQNSDKDGIRYVQAYTLEDVVLDGTDGEVAKITISMPEDVTAGEYPIVITAGEIANGTSNVVIDRVKSTLTVKDYIVGDANGDGRVSIADVSTLAGFLLGKPSADFVEAAADANGDGRVSIADVSTLASKLLGK